MHNFLFQFSVENFKVFSKKTTFQFAPVTILTGTNSSGKSTISQAIRLFSGMYRGKVKDLTDFFALATGMPYDLIGDKAGEFKNMIYRKDEKKRITFAVPVWLDSSPERFEMRVEFSMNPNFLQGGRFESLRIAGGDQQPRFLLFREALRPRGNPEKISTVVKARLDYFSWYLDHIRMREGLKRITGLSKEIRHQKELLNNVNEKMVEELNHLVTGLYGPGMKEHHDIVFGDIDIDFFGFDINRKYIERHIRRLPRFPHEFSEPELIIDLDFLFLSEHHQGVLSQIESIFPDEFKEYPNSIDRMNLKILKLISAADVEIFTEQMENDGLLPVSSKTEVIYPEERLLKMLTDNLAVEPFLTAEALEKRGRLGFRMELNKPTSSEIFSAFGNAFFSNLSREVNDCIQTANAFPEPRLFDGELRINRSRSVVLSTRNQDAADLINFFSDGKNDLKIFQDFINQWLTRFEAGESIRFDQAGQNLQVLVDKGQQTYNLTDEGQGISLLIHLLIRICTVAEREVPGGWIKKLVVLEEPENGLHPAMQSKLAELFHAVYKEFNIQVLVETHSEYLIRQFQVMVAKGEMDPEDVQIHYLHKPGSIPEGSEQVMPINILKDGSLTRNFGRGFFDESSSLNLAMYLHGGSRKN